MKQINYTIISIVLVAVLAACGKEVPKSAEELTAVAVKTGKSTPQEAANYISASGKLAAVKSANISTRMMGHVSQLNVTMGQMVKKGDILVNISNTDLLAKKSQVEAGIAQATTAFENAKKDHERFKKLHEQKSASDKELENVTMQYEMAKAGLAQTNEMKKEVQAQFAYLNIQAPFSGRVINTFVKEGDMANPGHPLVSIESTEALDAIAMVSEEDIEAVKKGMEARVFLKSLDTAVSGTVSEVSYSSKNTGGQYIVKISVENPTEKMLSGMFVNVQLKGNDIVENNNLLIPESAITYNGQLQGIYTISDNNKAILRWLRLGKKVGGEVEVLSGLSPNELYITEAKGKLFNGVPVTY
ncbi:MAG: RND family efflux transporter MFP subunit [Vicingaceae bacterium]|jgi:RND family efflux transporter MFP subunit